MGSAWSFAARGDGSDTLEIDVFGFVGPGEHWYGGISAKSLNALLKANKTAKTIKLRINSEGGDVRDGFAVYDQLVTHPAAVEVDIIGLAASMATVLAMTAAPGKLRMSENAWFMIHNPWGVEVGDANDMRRWADVLDKMTDQLAAAYEARSSLGIDEIKQMMAAETWMTASEAQAKGFVDVVTKPAKQKGKASARAFASLRDFNHAPAALLAQFEGAQMTLPPVGEENPANNTGKDRTMNEELKTLFALLGVSSVAEATQRITALGKLEAATGKTGDEAHGIVLAWKGDAGKFGEARAQLEQLQKRQDASELDAAISAAKAEKKLTPAEETTLRESIAAGDITLKGAKSMLATKAPHAALVNAANPATAATTTTTGTTAPTHNGKTYAQMKPSERAALKRENPELFKAMSAAAAS